MTGYRFRQCATKSPPSPSQPPLSLRSIPHSSSILQLERGGDGIATPGADDMILTDGAFDILEIGAVAVAGSGDAL